MLVIVFVWLCVFALTLDAGLVSTSVLFLVVVGVGLWQCQRTAYVLRDPRLGILRYLWIIKISATLSLLLVGWIPSLYPMAIDGNAYDPHRYFHNAFITIENQWVPPPDVNINNGVIYYYAALFYVFGHNPVIPAIVNSFVGLMATLYLIRFVYEFKRRRSDNDRALAYLLLLPELLWYDALTSRESITAGLIVVSLLAIARFVVRSPKASLATTVLLGAGGFLGVLTMRPAMCIGITAALSLFVIFVGSVAPGSRARHIALTVGALFLITAMLSLLLTEVPGFGESLNEIYLRMVPPADATSVLGWAENSFGQRLVPSNMLEAVVYIAPRLVLYLIAPLPYFPADTRPGWFEDWYRWQYLCTAISSVLNLIAVPYACAGLVCAFRSLRSRPALLAIHLGLWCLLVTIVAGNIIIHERYRVMATLLLFTCAWHGFTECSRRTLVPYRLAWWFLLLLFGFVILWVKSSG